MVFQTPDKKITYIRQLKKIHQKISDRKICLSEIKMKNIIFQTKGKKISEANSQLSDKKNKYFRYDLGIQGQKMTSSRLWNQIFQMQIL